MAYVEVYFAQWDDFGGKVHEIKLLQEGGSGTTRIVKMAPIPYTHQIRGGKDAPIKRQIQGSEIKFNFEVASADIATFDAIFESVYKEWKIEHYYDSTLDWVGWLQPDNYGRDYAKEGDSYFISLSAVDGLANLKNVEFVNASDGTQYDDRVTIMTTIKRALEHVGHELNFRVQLATVCTNDSLMLATDNALDKVTCDSRRFVESKDGRIINSDCYTVISELLRPFSCYLMQSQGEYWIINSRDFFVDVFKFLWTDLSLDSKAQIGSSEDITSAETTQLLNHGNVQRIIPIEQVGVTFRDRAIGANLLSDGDFASGTTTEWNNRAGPADWGSFTATAFEDDFELRTLNRDAVDGTPTVPMSFYSDAHAFVSRGEADQIEVTFKVRCAELTMAGGFGGDTWEEAVQSTCQLRKTTASGTIITAANPYPISLRDANSVYTLYTFFFDVTDDDDYFVEFVVDKVAPNWSDFDIIDLRYDDIFIVIKYSTGEDITFDKHYKITNTDSTFIGVEDIELNFGDSVSDGDIAAFKISGTRTKTWDRWLKTEDISINTLAGQNIIEDYQKYKDYFRLTITDNWAANTPRLFPHRLIEISGVKYRMVSQLSTYGGGDRKILKVELVELGTDAVGTSVQISGLSTVDGVGSFSTPFAGAVVAPPVVPPAGESPLTFTDGLIRTINTIKLVGHLSKWYVDKAGIDSNPGNIESLPFLTISAAITAAAANDVIYVGVGTFTESLAISKSLTIIGVGVEVFLTSPWTSITSTITFTNNADLVLRHIYAVSNLVESTSTSHLVVENGEFFSNNSASSITDYTIKNSRQNKQNGVFDVTGTMISEGSRVVLPDASDIAALFLYHSYLLCNDLDDAGNGNWTFYNSYSEGSLGNTGTTFTSFNSKFGTNSMRGVLSSDSIDSHTIRRELTQAEMQALNSFPITLISIGATSIGEVISVVVFNEFNTAAYATATQLRFKYSGSGTSLGNTTTSFVQAAADRSEKVALPTSSFEIVKGEDIIVDADADATLGNAATKVHCIIEYKTIST